MRRSLKSRDYLQNGLIIEVSKIRKAGDQLQPLPHYAKKTDELWSTNKKVIGAHVDPSKMNTICGSSLQMRRKRRRGVEKRCIQSQCYWNL